MKARHTGTYLDRILADTAAGLTARGDLPAGRPAAGAVRGFARALEAPGMSLIAEVKRASPSKGLIRPDFQPAAIARAYTDGGAAALSVLTDEPHFQGKLAYLDEVRAVTALPMLRKDFIIHPAQVWEAVGRADAVLLIVAALTADDLAYLHAEATSCGLDVLVEVHDRAEVDIAVALGARIIGINNRDLHSFIVDVARTGELRPYIPADRLVVSESGIGDPAQVRALADMGVDAVLVGEALMRQADVTAATRLLLGS